MWASSTSRAFLPGFSASVDYWNIDLKDAISTISAQQIADLSINKGQTGASVRRSTTAAAAGHGLPA